ncbi:phospholipase D family protein [Phnomibacter sp. MR]|uniref:phospholipase D family protein n=1 Tax=Phnomibacter sp. MR TaxID=3042318 RepID=UPI003A806F83
MPKLLNRFGSADALKEIIREANDYLILISPYFKLNNEIKSELSKLKQKDGVLLIVVYGKNEEDKRKSLSEEDFEFFKTFSNVEIRYHKRLHAKMYVNEEKCLITSLNLHDYSLKENIEVGILTKSKMFDVFTSAAQLVSKDLVQESLDVQAAEFADYIVEKSTCEFEKKQKESKFFFGLFTSRSEQSEVLKDRSRTGFCIRTKMTIPLNLKHPYSAAAYQSWSQYKNEHYKEKFCHGCGKPHPATMAKPVCLDCFKNIKSA